MGLSLSKEITGYEPVPYLADHILVLLPSVELCLLINIMTQVDPLHLYGCATAPVVIHVGHMLTHRTNPSLACFILEYSIQAAML